MIRKKILITSLPRSGSTWVLNILGIRRRIISLHEPDHLDVMGIGDAGMHPYIKDCARSDAYYRMYSRIFKGIRPASSVFSAEYALNIAKKIHHFKPVSETLIVKSVFSLHNTEWIYKKFSPQVVVLLRHPCSIIHSIHRKWPDARLKELLDQPAFVSDYLSPYQETLKSAVTVHEVLASRVAAYYRVVLDACAIHPSWIVLTHEQLCKDPLGEYRKLYNRLGLEWDGAVEAVINKTNRPKESDNIAHVNRLASDEAGKWRRLLTDQEIDEISRFYCPFELPYYRGFC